MILKASQRKGGKDLAIHLMRGDTNDHVTVHEVKGFISDHIEGAFQEAYALSLGTKCSQYLFSLSLNPPEMENVPIEHFERAIADIEKSLGLIDHPRVIVFHEKNGRRHCHCVWSRIFFDGEKFKALNMAHYKRKLNALAKGLFLEHGWPLPEGFKDKSQTETYALAEWQQAERLKEDPARLKSFFKSCWAQSDDKRSFAAALQEYGFYLAKGGRRGFVAVDVRGEVYSLSRWLGEKGKALKAKLGEPDNLPAVEEAHHYAQSRMSDDVKSLLREHRSRAKEQRAPLVKELRDLVQHQRTEREALIRKQRARWVTEHKARLARFKPGVSGLWDQLSGKAAEVKSLNKQEVATAQKRDRQEMQVMIARHLDESRDLHQSLKFYREEQRQDEWRLKRDVAKLINDAVPPEPSKPQQSTVEEKLAALESRMAMMTSEIALLQGALDDALLSDEMKAKLRVLIERAKEMFTRKRMDEEQVKLNQKLSEEELIQKQQELYRLMQSYETLRRQQEEQQRRSAANVGFISYIRNMSFHLNGLPLYKITLTEKPFDDAGYQQTLRQRSNTALLRSVTTKAQRGQIVSTDDLRRSALDMKETLRRANSKPTTPVGRSRRTDLNKNIRL